MRQVSNGTISKVSCMKKDIHPKFYPEAKARRLLDAFVDSRRVRHATRSRRRPPTQWRRSKQPQ